jgi:hypothetical protein
MPGINGHGGLLDNISVIGGEFININLDSIIYEKILL